MSRFVPVCKAEDVPPGTLLQVELEDGTPICVANIDGRFLAIGGECTHAGGPMGEGTIEGLCAVCPWHGGAFDLETGEAKIPPAHEPVPSYRVLIDSGQVSIELED